MGTAAPKSTRVDLFRVTFLYAAFAALATLCNIGAQDLAIRFYTGAYAVSVSIFWGTGVGFLVKYVLDKKYIFRFRARNLRQDTQVFVLYSIMGVATTLVFWGFEFGFDWFFHRKSMRYLGAVLGLAVGYWSKYQLDKRFVFGMDPLAGTRGVP